MDEEFQARLAAELAEGHEPPLGDLVVVALRQGKRLRLVRRAKIAAGAVVATSVLVVGLLLGGQALVAGTGHQRVSAATGAATARLTVVPSSSADPDVPWSAGDPAPVIEQPAGPMTPATPAALAYRLEELLPSGQPSGIIRLAGGRLEVQLTFDRGQGPGLVSLAVVPNSWAVACSPGGDPLVRCYLGPQGAHVSVSQNPGNCVDTTTVVVDHGNGVTVQITLATCLAWNGSSNPRTREALSLDEAISIAADPTWGLRMGSSLVAIGNELHPALSAW